MKTVHFDAYAQYIKLCLYQPFENKLNIFDQVSLISISAIGEPIDGLEDIKALEKFKQGNYVLPDPNLQESRKKYITVASVNDSELDPAI